MNQELQKQLFDKYPKLFAQKDWSITNSCMPFGLECGTGWYNIIDNACYLIQSHINSQRKQRAIALRYNRALKYALSGKKEYLVNWYKKLYKDSEQTEKRVQKDIFDASFREVPPKMMQIEFTQVKEKFGGLRLYTDYVDNFIDGVISMASQMSECTCETCGNPGKMRGKHWYYVACDEHTDKKDLDDTEE